MTLGGATVSNVTAYSGSSHCTDTVTVDGTIVSHSVVTHVKRHSTTTDHSHLASDTLYYLYISI